jgi:hypothetical protein
MWGRRSTTATGRSGLPVSRRDLLEATAVAAVVCALEAVVLAGTSEYRGFVAGVVAATTFWLVALRLLGAAPARERRPDPRDLTRRLVDAEPRWRAVHGLTVDGRDVDHVVVTPLAVLAVRSEHWDDDTRRPQAVDAARDDARRLADALARLGVEVPVWPAVVAWGPGAPVTELGPVDLVAGADADSWTAAYATGAITERRAAQVHAGLLRLRADADRTLDLREKHVTEVTAGRGR